ncbi:MAG TPA: glycosyltransferase [candidate division Zixibacteria bacterium]|nr:glycosyltransferase [candidate division Zixibacteria bacterium]
MIERIAIAKHGAMLTEIRKALGKGYDESVPIMDSIVSYAHELVNIVGERTALFIGLTACIDEKTAPVGRHTAMSIATGMSNEATIPLRIAKRLRVSWKIKRALNEFSPQLIASFGGYSDMAIFIEWARANNAIFIPIVVAPLIAPKDPFRMKLWRRAISGITRDDVPAVFVRGEFLRDHLIETFGIPAEKIHVYWPKYPREFFDSTFENPLDQSRRNILYVGRLSEEKGVLLLPEILEMLLEKLDRIKLTIIGSGPQENRLRTQLEKISQEGDKWQVFGFMPQKEILPYCIHCDALIVPSFIEGFGKVAYEGLLCGAPIVASNLHNIPYLIEDGVDGFLVEPGDSAGFAEAVGKIIDGELNSRKSKETGAIAKEREFPSLTEVFTEVLDVLEKSVS